MAEPDLGKFILQINQKNLILLEHHQTVPLRKWNVREFENTDWKLKHLEQKLKLDLLAKYLRETQLTCKFDLLEYCFTVIFWKLLWVRLSIVIETSVRPCRRRQCCSWCIRICAPYMTRCTTFSIYYSLYFALSYVSASWVNNIKACTALSRWIQILKIWLDIFSSGLSYVN